MYDYMRALHDRFCQEPELREVRRKLEMTYHTIQEKLVRQDQETLLQLADLGFLDRENHQAAVDLLLRSRLTEATAFLLDYCNRRWPRQARDAGADFLDAEFAL